MRIPPRDDEAYAYQTNEFTCIDGSHEESCIDCGACLVCDPKHEICVDCKFCLNSCMCPRKQDDKELSDE